MKREDVQLRGSSSDAQLVANAVRAARPHRTTPANRWVAVKETFMVGSTTAKSLCRRFDLDPYEDVPGAVCGACDEDYL